MPAATLGERPLGEQMAACALLWGCFSTHGTTHTASAVRMGPAQALNTQSVIERSNVRLGGEAIDRRTEVGRCLQGGAHAAEGQTHSAFAHDIGERFHDRVNEIWRQRTCLIELLLGSKLDHGNAAPDDFEGENRIQAFFDREVVCEVENLEWGATAFLRFFQEIGAAVLQLGNMFQQLAPLSQAGHPGLVSVSSARR